MGQSRSRSFRIGAVVALLVAGVVTGVGAPPATGQVTAVRGSAFGYSLRVDLFAGQPTTVLGPAPTVTLPAGGSASPLTATLPSALAEVSPATFFTSGQLEVSTQGTTASGSVTSTARITNINTSQAEVLTAGAISSTCTASGSGLPTGSTSITGGVLFTDSGTDRAPAHQPVSVQVPANPAPNTIYDGHVHIGAAQDNFRYIFNEQIRNADGSLTVNAARQILQGPIARGELIIGQVLCGVTGSTAATTTITPGATTTTTTTAPGATTTTAPGATTTAAPTTTTTVAATTTSSTTAPATTTTATSGTTTGVGGGAYGFFASVGLFGGPAATRGPAPSVSLPAAGSATPVTGTAATGSAEFGPATIFSSGKLDVSTQGVPGGSVTSSATVANVNTSGDEVLTASSLASMCTASSSGVTGSTTVTGGKVRTSEGNPDVDGDDTDVALPANPAPNTTFTGTIEAVGDTFRYVFNEQIRGADGSLTVNAAHMYLLGPTAIGELIIGQSRCGVTAAAAGSGAGGAAGGGSGATQSVGVTRSGLAVSGSAVAVLVALALMLLVGGSTTTYWVAGARWGRVVARRMPWGTRGR